MIRQVLSFQFQTKIPSAELPKLLPVTIVPSTPRYYYVLVFRKAHENGEKGFRNNDPFRLITRFQSACSIMTLRSAFAIAHTSSPIAVA